MSPEALTSVFFSVVLAAVLQGAANASRSELVASRSGAEPPLRVVAKGFSVRPGKWGNPGVVIRNTSKTRDALGVEVEVTWLAKDGTPVQTDGDEIAVIPAAMTFYWGDQTVFGPGVPARIDVSVSVRSTRRRACRLPLVSNLRMTGRTVGTFRVIEDVTNTLGKPLDPTANAYAVVFDGQRRVIGGSRSILGAPLKANQRARVVVTMAAVVPARAASARGSAENEGGTTQPVC